MKRSEPPRAIVCTRMPIFGNGTRYLVAREGRGEERKRRGEEEERRGGVSETREASFLFKTLLLFESHHVAVWFTSCVWFTSRRLSHTHHGRVCSHDTQQQGISTEPYDAVWRGVALEEPDHREQHREARQKRVLVLARRQLGEQSTTPPRP